MFELSYSFFSSGIQLFVLFFDVFYKLGAPCSAPAGAFFFRPKSDLYFLRSFLKYLKISDEIPRTYENKKEPPRPQLSYGEARKFIALLCVTKQRIPFSPKTLLWGADGDGGGGGGDGGRISSNLQPPFPSHPGITYPVRAPALTPI